MNRPGIILQQLALRAPTPSEVNYFGVEASGNCAVYDATMAMRRYEFEGAGIEMPEGQVPYMTADDAFAAFQPRTHTVLRAELNRGFIAAMFFHFDRGNRLRALDVGRVFIESQFALEEMGDGETGEKARFDGDRLNIGNYHWFAGELNQTAGGNTFIVDRAQQEQIFDRRRKLVDRWRRERMPDLIEFVATTAV